MTDQPPVREPMFNIPLAALLVIVSIVGSYAVQQFLPPSDWIGLALSPKGLADGRWWPLVTSLFLHSGWLHALANAGWALAFGPPVARLMGAGPRGTAVFLLFYLVCGALAGWAFCLVHPGETGLVVGASGAVSALMGGASRLIDWRGHLAPVWTRTAIAMAVFMVIGNVLLSFSGLTPGAEGLSIAWEAHIGGFFAGLLLIGPFARLARGR